MTATGAARVVVAVAAAGTLLLMARPRPDGVQEGSGVSRRAEPPHRAGLKITSPQGRTGTVTRIRIVAQLDGAAAAPLSPVEFLVDGEKVGTVTQGPPWVVEWVDDNPLERREIVVQATNAAGEPLRDSVVLPPWEVTDQTDVNGILLETSVYDAHNRLVSDLAPAAFGVAENQQPQVIDLVTKETVGTDLVLLVDNSQSMAARMDVVRRAAERLAGQLRAKDRAILVPFNSHIGTITGPTRDVATIGEAVHAMTATGRTALLDAIGEGLKLLAGSDGRKSMVLITDGYDEGSHDSLQDVLRIAGETQATIYAVGIGGAGGLSLRGRDMLTRIAEVSGGRAYFPPRDIDLANAVHAITADSQSRYLITYTPSNQRRDGSWREIAVQVPPGLRAKTRSGYFAPEPAPIRPTIEFTVLDGNGRYADLTRADLEVFEDDAEQEVNTFQEAVDPVSIVLELDQSGSMKKAADLVRTTAAEFIHAVRPEDSLALILFSDKPYFAHVLSTNRQWSLDAIAKYTPNGGTALYDALWNALQHVKGIAARRAIVVLSDGRDENNPGTAPGSIHTLDQVMALRKDVGAAIFTVALGSNVDARALERLAVESGGQTYHAADAEGLGAQFQRVVQDLRRRYVISYSSTNRQHDGSWRRVVVRPRNPDFVVLSTNGYFAPEK